jgi:hypothetical protein
MVVYSELFVLRTGLVVREVDIVRKL